MGTTSEGPGGRKVGEAEGSAEGEEARTPRGKIMSKHVGKREPRRGRESQGCGGWKKPLGLELGGQTGGGKG